MKKVALVCVVSPMLCAGTLASQSYTWRSLSGPYPSGRSEHGMVYDSVRNQFVVFGGHGVAGPGQLGILGDTWIFDGAVWGQALPAASPTPRTYHGLAFDSLRGVAILFGGDDSALAPASDTWEWDGASWSLIQTATTPPGRELPAMTFDSLRGRVVMFGGSGGGALSDTWEFDGSDWSLVTTPTTPPARYRHAMTFDSGRGVAVLYGGKDASGVFDDTWEFDGATWTQVATQHTPGGRYAHAMAYGTTNGVTVLTTGRDATGGWPVDTWVYDGSDWAPAPTSDAPSPVRGAALAYDPAQQQMVLFGGYRHYLNYTNNTYVLDTWPAMSAMGTPFGTGCGSPPLSLSTPASARPIIGAQAEVVMTNSPTQFGGFAVGWSNTFSWPIPLPFEMGYVGMPGCYLLQSNDVFGLPATQVAAGTLSYSESIPFNPYLLGAHLYLQAYAYAPGANTAQIIASNGIDWTIGNQ